MPKKKSLTQLLNLYCDLLRELRRRNLIRTENIPTGDLAETLVVQALKLRPENSSNIGCDARHCDGRRFQIKGRRLTPLNKSRQLLPPDPRPCQLVGDVPR